MAKAKKKVDEAMVSEWMEAKDNANRWKDRENALRLLICELLVPEANSGTFKFDIGKLPVKVQKKLNHSIDRDTYEQLCDAFSEQEKSCIRVNYELAMKQYNAIIKSIDHGADIDLDNLHQCITTKPAMPTLSVGSTEEDD